ncbi:hypothetical protein WS54_16525 [Burkholderia sp. NRF60-BP8]|nr:hypothetical protein WS54_16525 [Burkholderia sp. NRF60-BP8]
MLGAVASTVDLPDLGHTFSERSAIMVDQTQGATGKGEKAGKPIVVDQKQDVASNSTGNDTAAKAAQAAVSINSKRSLLMGT